MLRIVPNEPAPARRPRRTLLKAMLGFGLSVPGVITRRAAYAATAPVVRVAAPIVARRGECRAAISVKVTIAELVAGARYEASGDVMEGDTPDGDPDLCCMLDPRTMSGGNQSSAILLLTAQTTAADLGLVKGVGPAGDEAHSPDLVELFARVWLRDLATDERYGPWDSPVRVAVSRATLDWTHAGALRGRELMAPRGGTPAARPDGRDAPPPPPACLP